VSSPVKRRDPYDKGLTFENRQSVMVQKPEMPHLKRLSEEFDELSERDRNSFVKL
jgi:hypothetical protein